MEEKPRHAAPESRRPPIASTIPSRGARLRAASGETAAECAAVLCCCPCCLASLVVVAAVKLPSAIAQRARWRRRRDQVCLKEKRTKANGNKVGAFHDDENNSRGGFILAADTEEPLPWKTTSEELMELEKVMIAKFYGAGFWRSPSQREK